jgi:5'-methylthioadenosine phosphorylase
MKTLLVGGTGFSEMDYLDAVVQETVRTPFGGATIFLGRFEGMDSGFLPRHGVHHEMLAPQVNYRANVWAAHQLGFRCMLGTSAVASLNTDIAVGDLVVPHQLVDLSKHRQDSFFLRSVNMTEPFSPAVRQTILQVAEEEQIPAHGEAIYITSEGPRYETGAEIALFSRWGMDVIGMTNGTEAGLCRELDLCYATIALVTNMGAGITAEGPNLERHRAVTRANLPRYKQLALSSLRALLEAEDLPPA